MTNILRIAAAIVAVLAFTTAAEAKRHHSHAGACDGYHRCRCGVTAARNTGLPLNYNGFNLKRAIEWTKALPRTNAHPGAVVYQHGGGPSGHVMVIDRMVDSCTAIVRDDAGTHPRNICARGAVYLDPNGNGATPRRHYAERQRHHHHRRYAQQNYWQPEVSVAQY